MYQAGIVNLLARQPELVAHAVLPIPGNLSMTDAAALPEAFAAAWLAVIGRASLREGETVMVHAAASGVAIATMQLLSWRGHKVFVTARKQWQID